MSVDAAESGMPDATNQSGPTQDNQRMQPPVAPAADAVSAPANTPTGTGVTPPPAVPGVAAKPAQPAVGTQATAEQNPVQPGQNHGSLFQNIFGVLAGGKKVPVRDGQGNPVTNPDGTVQTKNATTKQLGAGILAGAIASMMAGFEHVPDRNGNGMVATHLGEASAAGAAAGAANTQDARVKQAQGVSDEQRLRQYATTKQNYDMQSMAMTNATLGDERLKSAAQTFQPLHDWITSEAANDPTIAGAIHGDELSADELHDLLTKEDGAHVTRDFALPSGVRPEMKDGKPTGKLEQTWMAIKADGKITLTPELAEKYGLTNLAPNTQVPIGVIMKAGTNKAVGGSVSQIFDDMNGQQEEEFGKQKGGKVSLTDMQKTIPGLKNPEALKALQSLAGLDPGEAIVAAKNIPGIGGQVSAYLANKFGNSAVNDWVNKRDKEKKLADAANDPNKQPVPDAQVKTFGDDMKKLYPNLDPARVDAAVHQLGPNPNQGQLDKTIQNIQKADESQRTYEANQQKIADKEAETNGSDTYFSTPDATGFMPNKNLLGNFKGAQKVSTGFKKQADEITKMDGTFQQFQSILNDVKAGKDLTGAQSVVALFNAIGISATPLAGKGFRINNNTVEEHANARGLGQDLYQKLLKLQTGAVITPQQIADYAKIASETRVNQYVNVVNQAHAAGVNADPLLPTGNGQAIDPNTAAIFARLSGWSGTGPLSDEIKAKAKKASTAKGWQ